MNQQPHQQQPASHPQKSQQKPARTRKPRPENASEMSTQVKVTLITAISGIIVAIITAILGPILLARLSPPATPTPTPTSSIDTTSCEHGAYGFMNIPDSLSGTREKPPVYLSRDVIVTIESNRPQHPQRGWAKISGKTSPGDQVWMDWTQDGGVSWLQCGPFFVTTPGLSKNTRAKLAANDPNWQFRACGKLAAGGNPKCTDWW